MKKLVQIIFIVLVPQIIIAVIIYNYQNIKKQGNLEELRETYAQVAPQPVDHGKFEILQQKFDNPHQVTEACLSCHTERGKELLESTHFKWEREAFIPGKGVVYIGKKKSPQQLLHWNWSQRRNLQPMPRRLWLCRQELRFHK